MSFLNPVNEPVLRFSSTDAGAPQINYNARVAGDVKAVLKACLVTGYGAIASAGWTAVNEVGNVIEFVSPSAAMSSYRLGIDDTSAASTVLYYFASGVRYDMGGGLVRNTGVVVNTSSSNGWELLVSARGIFWIENVMSNKIGSVVSSVTYWGQLKPDKEVVSGKNIALWSIGYNSPATDQGSPSAFFTSATGVGKKYVVADSVVDKHAHTAINTLSSIGVLTQVSDIELFSEWFLIANNGIVAQQPALLLSARLSSEGVPTVGGGMIAGRNVLKVWPVRGATSSTTSFIYNYSPAIMAVYLDYWEY